MRLKHLFAASGILASLALLSAGCGHKEDALATPQGQALLKTHTIITQSGGDWNKLSPADQQALISGPGGGSVQGAKAFLAGEAARQNFHPGPPVTIPKGPPPH